MAKAFQTPILLIIADNVSVIAWMKRSLSDQFFIIEATRRAQALSIVQNTPLDFIFLDSAFEDCDPFKLSKEIRKISQNQWTPIFLITGKLRKSYREKALDAGVSDFINSEFDIDEIETRIATEKKAASLREKTGEASSILKQTGKEFSKSYFKNKLLIHDQALRILTAAKIENIPLILLVLQIDHFDEFIKEEGFLLSEQILSQCSNILEDELKEPQLLIPSTNGKFFILLPNCTSEQGKVFAEHLQKVVQKSRFTSKKGYSHLTLSIALSPLKATENSLNQMIEAASKALGEKISKSLIISLDQEIL